MKVTVDYENFVKIATALDAQAGDRVRLFYVDNEDGFYKIGMTSGNMEWFTTVHVPSISKLFLSNFLKTAIKVEKLE